MESSTDRSFLESNEGYDDISSSTAMEGAIAVTLDGGVIHGFPSFFFLLLLENRSSPFMVRNTVGVVGAGGVGFPPK